MSAVTPLTRGQARTAVRLSTAAYLVVGASAAVAWGTANPLAVVVGVAVLRVVMLVVARTTGLPRSDSVFVRSGLESALDVAGWATPWRLLLARLLPGLAFGVTCAVALDLVAERWL